MENLIFIIIAIVAGIVQFLLKKNKKNAGLGSYRTHQEHSEFDHELAQFSASLIPYIKETQIVNPNKKHTVLTEESINKQKDPEQVVKQMVKPNKISLKTLKNKSKLKESIIFSQILKPKF